jgi:hypothetical protein
VRALVDVTPVDATAVLKGVILVVPAKVDLAAATEATTEVVIVALSVTLRLAVISHPVQISPRVEILLRVRRHRVVILECRAEISLLASRHLVSHLVLLNQAMGAKYLFHETLKSVPHATQTNSVDQAMPLRRASSRNKAAWSKSAMPFFMPCA